MSNITLQASPASLTFVANPITGYSARLGMLPSFGTEQNGDCWIYQDVAIPVGTTTLTFQYWPFTQDGITFDWQTAEVRNLANATLATIFLVCENDQVWKQKTFDLSPYAGTTIRLWFAAHGDNSGDYTYMYLDAISAVNGSTELIQNGSFGTGTFANWTIGADGGASFNPVTNQVHVFGQENPASQTSTISSSDGNNTPFVNGVDFGVVSDQTWLSVTSGFSPPTDGETAQVDTVNVDIHGLAAGAYTGHLTCTRIGWDVIAPPTTIISPIPAPGGNWANATNYDVSNICFALTGNKAFHTVSFANGGNPVFTYGVTIDRAANTASYATLHNPGTTPPYWTANVITTDDTYIYCCFPHGNPSSLEIEKRLASDWSLSATLSISGVGSAQDIDLVTISGTQYLAITVLDAAGNINKVYAIRTSDMTTVFSKTHSFSAALSDNLCAFDASGNLWFMITPDVYPHTLSKVTIPGGTQTDYTMSGDASTDGLEGMTFDPTDGKLILFSSSEAYRFDISGTPTQTQEVAHGFGGLALVPQFDFSPRLTGGATLMWSRGFFFNEPLTEEISVGPIQRADSNAVTPTNLDDTTNNPHKTSAIDCTFWCMTPNGGSGPVHYYEYIDLALVQPVVIPVTLLLGSQCGRVTISGIFQDAKGAPLAGGKIRVYPYTDCKTCDNKQLAAGIFYDTALDGSGSIPNGNLLLYPTVQLTADGPDVGTYRIQVFSSKGVLAWQKNKITIPNTNPFDLSTL